MHNPRLLSIIRKEFIQIWRDPRTLGLILVIPIMQLFLLGYSAKSEVQNLNLAAYLEDGKYIQVPAIATITATIENPPLPTWGVRSFVIDSKININTASQQELESLPFIGSEYALRIIAYRNANGPFETIEAIQEVYGIGPKTFENIKDLITVENPP